MTITKSFLFSLEFANTDEESFLQKLWNAYKEVMQHFIDVGIAQNRMPDYQAVKTCPVGSFLSARYKACALEQAKAILKNYFKLKKKRKNKEPKKPEIKKTSLKLDKKFFKLEKGENEFWLKLRDSERQEWIAFAVKNKYAKGYFENWEPCPFIEILQKDDGKWYAKLCFKKTVELKEKEPKGIDIDSPQNDSPQNLMPEDYLKYVFEEEEEKNYILPEDFLKLEEEDIDRTQDLKSEEQLQNDNSVQDLNRLREELQKAVEMAREKKRQEKRMRQKLKKLKVFKRRRLPKLCVYFLADKLDVVPKLVQELKDLREVLDESTIEGKAMLRILEALDKKGLEKEGEDS